MLNDSHTITDLLDQWRAGDRAAGDKLIEVVYGELHRIAAREMRRENSAHTLQTTALVHEAYLRLSGAAVNWKDRAHFFAVAARQLRRVLVDHARRARSRKRGGDQIRLELVDSDGSAWLGINEQLLAVDESLSRLEALDKRAAAVVDLRFFAGLSEAETAEAMGVSLATVKRDWDFARTWLAGELGV